MENTLYDYNVTPDIEKACNTISLYNALLFL